MIKIENHWNWLFRRFPSGVIVLIRLIALQIWAIVSVPSEAFILLENDIKDPPSISPQWESELKLRNEHFRTGPFHRTRSQTCCDTCMNTLPEETPEPEQPEQHIWTLMPYLGLDDVDLVFRGSTVSFPGLSHILCNFKMGTDENRNEAIIRTQLPRKSLTDTLSTRTQTQT